MSSRTRTREESDEVVINRAQIHAVQEGASWLANKLDGFVRNPGAGPAIPKEELYVHPCPLILNEAEGYRVDLVDDRGNLVGRASGRFRYVNGRHGRF